MPTKKYTGNCHCKKVQYEATIDISKGTSKCNCSFCSRARSWKAFIKPSDFRLLAGENELTAYHGRNETSQSFFCKTCGIRTHESGNAEWMGGEFVGVYLTTLNDVDQNELATAPVYYADGLNNNWMNKPQDVRNL